MAYVPCIEVACTLPNHQRILADIVNDFSQSFRIDYLQKLFIRKKHLRHDALAHEKVFYTTGKHDNDSLTVNPIIFICFHLNFINNLSS